MARRKKHHSKAKHTRRRRISGVSAKGGIMSAAGIIAGAVVAQALGKLVIDKMTSTMSASTQTLIDGAAPIAIGLVLPRFMKSDMGKNIGAGMVAVGGLKLVQSAGVLNGIDGFTDPYANKPQPKVSGFRTNVQGNYISGFSTDNNNYISGLAALHEMEK